MELLPEGQKNTTEVLFEDQKKINKFSLLISNKDELEAQLALLKLEKEYCGDLELELELLDEDDKVQYKVGDAFVFLKVESAVKRIEAENERLDAKIDEIDSEIDAIDTQLLELKEQLYAKFGNNINLER